MRLHFLTLIFFFHFSSGEEILEKGGSGKSTDLYVKSATQVVLFEKQSPFNPLDSAENYRLVRDQYQSFTASLHKNNGRRRHGVIGGAELWSEDDSSGYELQARLSTLAYDWNHFAKFENLTLGRQNVYTGFHFYKLDGVSSVVAFNDDSRLSAFAGFRVDTLWNLDNGDNPAVFLQYSRKAGRFSNLFVGFERSHLDGRLNANDLGTGFQFGSFKKIKLQSKLRVSWDEKVRVTEFKNLVRYKLTNRHGVYGGYNYFNPLFRDTLQTYFFDIFDYNKVYLGWNWRPFKKKAMRVNIETSALRIDEMFIYHAKAELITRFMDLSCIQRFGDFTAATVAIAQVKYPVSHNLMAGGGGDYANMDLYIKGSRDYTSYYVFLRYQPINPVSGLIRLENRRSPFAVKDIRVLGNFTVSFSNKKGRYFVWED